MKKLLFDLMTIQTGKGVNSGGGEYTLSIFKKIAIEADGKIELVVLVNNKWPIPDWVDNIIRKNKFRVINATKVTDVIDIFESEHPNIFFTGMPYGYTFDLRASDIYKIGTFHGLREYECQGDFYDRKYYDTGKIKYWVRELYFQYRFIPCVKEKKERKKREQCKASYYRALRNFDLIVATSTRTKYAYNALFGNDIAIETYYPPLKVRDLVKNVEDGGYILLTMSNRCRKNCYRAIKAVDNLHKKNILKEMKCYVVGDVSKIIENEFENNKRIVFYKSYLESDELERMYANCSVYVFPSRNEGFGYPPIEAMSYGKTCAVAADTAIPEVCGDAAYYFNPLDIFEMETSILEAIRNRIPREKIIERYNYINEKGEMDLARLCNKIMNG